MNCLHMPASLWCYPGRRDQRRGFGWTGATGGHHVSLWRSHHFCADWSSVVTQVKFRCEPMREGGIRGLCKQSDTNTHLHSDYKLHKNISGGSVCACAYRGGRGRRDDIVSPACKNVSKKKKKIGGGKQSLIVWKKSALWIHTKVAFILHHEDPSCVAPPSPSVCPPSL